MKIKAKKKERRKKERKIIVVMASRRRAMKDLGRVTFPPASTSGGGSPVTPPRVSLRRIQWRAIEHTVRLAPEAAGGRGRGCAGATPAPGRTARRWGRRGAGCRERSTCRPRRRSRGGVLAAAQLCEGGWGVGALGAATEQSLSHVCTHCAPRQASDTPWLKTAFSSSGGSTSHRAPRPLSAAQQQQAVRGQGTVCAALTCAARASTRVMATQLTLAHQGGELQAALIVPQRTGHGASKAAPPSLKHSD